MADVRNHAVRFSGEITLRQAKTACEDLHAAVADYDEVAVDGTDISAIDLSIAQLFVAAFKTAEASGNRFSVAFKSEGALDCLLRRAGFLDSEGEPLATARGPWLRTPGPKEGEIHV